MPALLRLRSISKAVPGSSGRPIIDGIDLEVESGEFVAIVGESGTGKSTLLNLIAGLDTADRGTVEFDGRTLGELDDDARTRIRRDRMGFVFQAFHLLPHLDLVTNVGLPRLLAGMPRTLWEPRAQALLAAVGLGERARGYPRELSGGELQRVAIARALVGSPGLVLADEPTGNLDPENARIVLELLRDQVTREGAAGVLVTHSRLAASIADRILVLSRRGLEPEQPGSAKLAD